MDKQHQTLIHMRLMWLALLIAMGALILVSKTRGAELQLNPDIHINFQSSPLIIMSVGLFFLAFIIPQLAKKIIKSKAVTLRSIFPIWIMRCALIEAGVQMNFILTNQTHEITYLLYAMLIGIILFMLNFPFSTPYILNMYRSK